MKSRAVALLSILCLILMAAPSSGQLFERTEPVLGGEAVAPADRLQDKAAFIAQYDDGEPDVFYNAGSDTYELAMLFDNVGGPDVTLESVDICLRQTTSDPMIRYQVVVWAADGAGGTPGTELLTVAAVATGVTATPTFDTTDLDYLLSQQDVYIGVRWNPAVDPTYSFCVDRDGIGGEVQPAYGRANESGAWDEVQDLFADPDYNALMFRAFITTPGVIGPDRVIVPGFEVDTTSATGNTTLFGVRNLTGDPISVDLQYYTQEGDLQREDTVDLGARETETVNIRNVPGLDTDFSGIARGYVEVVGPSDPDQTPLYAVDYLQVDVGDDFATGENARNFGDLCSMESIRFFDFASGTRLAIWIANPRGPSPGIDPFSFTVQVYDEAGNAVGTPVAVHTDQNSLEMEAADFTAIDFGTLKFNFSNAGRGTVFGEYSADGRFSVGFDSTCENP